MKLSELSTKEKMQLLTGVEGNYLNCLEKKLPTYVLADGPHGVKAPGERKKATSVPCMQNLGNSWDKEIAALMGKVLADDCILNDVDILLAPSMNIKRVAVCGRNFEYISEDSYLCGTLAKEYVNGLQSKGIAATIKHFCANNREYARFSVSSEVDERTLREVYLKPFEIALEAKPWMVMCSYNPLNGWYTSENKWLLQEILRGEFGFTGVIVSDWCAVHDRAKCLKAGMDLEMPYAERSLKNLQDAYARGFITDQELDTSAGRMLELIDKIEKGKSIRKVEMSYEQKHQAAVKMAEGGIVLLKNENNILPLSKNLKIAVIGELAAKPEMGGGGSSNLSGFCEYKPQNLADLLKSRLENCEVRYSSAYNQVIYNTNREWQGKYAITEAYDSDIAIVCVGNNQSIESECYDRENIKLPIVHENLILQIAKVNKNVIVVVTAGSCIDMSAWIDKVRGVIYTSFGGEGINEALANIITNKVCPSGKLSETFIKSIDDNPNNSFVGNGFVEKYNDGIYVGYKYYEKNNIPVLFPFGYGLSYANFIYSDLKIKRNGTANFEVSYTVENDSEITAKEISQVYVSDVFSMVEQPVKALKAYSKDEFLPGESKTIKFILNEDAFSYYSVIKKAWYIENGWFEILVGASSSDIRLTAKIEIDQDEDGQNSKFDDLYLSL